MSVQCFGSFEVFVDGKPLVFSRAKTKELFAYLVSRNGAFCSSKEIAAVIWNDTPDSDNLKPCFRHLAADLIRTLEASGAGGTVIKQKGNLAVVKDKLYCDLYETLKGSVSAFNSYRGEFMAQYNWAEFEWACL